MKEVVHLPTVAVVIPALNEEATIASSLASLCGQMDKGISILVADGGSNDSTRQVAEQYGANVVQSACRGRGCQIADVLSQVRDDVVLILHADMVLQSRSLERMRQWLLENPFCPGGSFGHRFANAGRIYRLVEWWDQVRARRGMSYGDQAQFFRRELIERHGGFPNQPIMEDFELSRRLMRLGKPVYLDCPVMVSPRRFEKLGWWRTITTNSLLRLSYRAGGIRVSKALYRRYYGHSTNLR